MNLLQWTMNSKIGTLHLVASDEGLSGVHWDEQNVPYWKENADASSPASGHLMKAAEQLDAYLNGERREFDVPLAMRGTPFQIEVWNELRRIPYGRTISYLELARRVSRPKAFRAVGTANGRNPLSLIVPCHRVIASDAGLGGYAGGLERKSWLLKLESI